MQRVGEYFMTQEAEMAARWKMFEDYKNLRSKLSVLEREANTLGLYLQRVSTALLGSPSKVRIEREKVIGVPVGDKWQEVDISQVDPNEIMKLLSDIQAVTKQKADLAGKLRELGMSLD
jgi:hypothetical protein